MRNRIQRPSPSMIVSLIALVLAMSGSAIAAVSFARNAGAVDGISAVRSGVSNSTAAGKLVATSRLGLSKGKIGYQYLPGLVTGRGNVSSFGTAAEVVDNATGAPVTLTTVGGVGTVTATCSDQAVQVNREDPSTTITFTNTSGQAVNFARETSNATAVVAPIPNGTVSSFTINGSNTFTINVLKQGTSLVIHGVVRQDGSGTATGNCVFYGQSIRVN